MRRVIVRLIAAIAVLAAALSCERRPLYDLTNTHYVRVYVDEELLNVTTGFYDEENNRPEYQSPQVIRIVLADPETGAMKADRYFRNRHKDAKGTYYDGFVIADPGIYDIYAYNFDTEATLIRDAANYDLITAYTNEIASHLRSKLYSRSRSGGSKAGDDERIVYDADHLFVSAVEGVTINYSDKLDTLYTPEGGYFEAESVVKSYYIQVKVKGMKYVSSAVAVLGGMAGSVQITSREVNYKDPVSIYFEMTPGGESESAGVRAVKADEIREGDPEDMLIMYTTFGTFGKIPQESNPLELSFDFMTVYGKPYSETIEIAPVFETEDAILRQWLLIEKVIEIPEPPKSANGFDPGLKEWNEEHIDIII